MYFSCDVDREVGVIHLNNEMSREAGGQTLEKGWACKVICVKYLLEGNKRLGS